MASSQQRVAMRSGARLWRGLVLLVAALSGCSTFRGHSEPATDRSADLASLRLQNTPAFVDACLATPTQDCRNRIVRARKAAEDIRFYEFEEKVFYEGRTIGFSSTLGILGLTTASAASSGGAGQVLAGLAALVTGGRETYQKEVLAEKTVQALFTAMRGNRAEVELRIRSGLLLPTEQYSLEDGIAHVEAYRRGGTVQGALDTVTESASEKTRQAEEELIERFSFKPDRATRELQMMVCGSTSGSCTLNVDAVRRMREVCWPQVGVPADTLNTDFMAHPRFAKERALTGACMAKN